MRVIRAFSASLRSVLTAPGLVAFLWLTLLVAAVPFGIMMQREVSRDIGASRAHVDLRERMDMVWLGEFQDRSTTLGKTLEPTTTSRADFLHNLDLLFSARLFSQHPGLVAAGVVYALSWLLLLGGVIDRFARGGGRFGLAQFLSASGRYFPRLFLVTLVSAVGYAAIYRLASWGYTAIEQATRDVTVEATILKYYILAALPVLLLTALVMAITGYARIAAVVEERSAWAALGRGARFVAGHPLPVLGLMLLVTLVALAIVALRTAVGPGVSESSVLGVLGVFLLGQLFLVSRLILRITRVGAELALYRALRS